MIQELDLDFIKREVRNAKARNKRSCKIKVSQWEFFEGKRPKIYLQTKGVDGLMKALEEEGFYPSLETQDKQVSIGYDLSGAIKSVKSRNLKTTTLVVKW